MDADPTATDADGRLSEDARARDAAIRKLDQLSARAAAPTIEQRMAKLEDTVALLSRAVQQVTLTLGRLADERLGTDHTKRSTREEMDITTREVEDTARQVLGDDAAARLIPDDSPPSETT